MTDPVNGDPAFKAAFDQMLADREAELHPDLVEWVEQGTWGPMLRHPLVYQIPLVSPGLANQAYEHKRKALAEAVAEHDWSRVIWTHERAHRLNAFIEYLSGRNEDGEVLPATDHFGLLADVWVDSENIQQNTEEWRALMLNLTTLRKVPVDHWGFLGTDEERESFQKLSDPIKAHRGGTVGDWSWTTDMKIAEFFARRSGLLVRTTLIPKADCFGYLTRRGESELLVRLTPERYHLVYPEGEPT